MHFLEHLNRDNASILMRRLDPPLQAAYGGTIADVIIDLSLVTTPVTGPALASRPARIQAAYLGYAVTMGSSQLSYDYWIADDDLVPPDELFVFNRGWIRRRELRGAMGGMDASRTSVTNGSRQARRGIDGEYEGGRDCLLCDVSVLTSAGGVDGLVVGGIRRVHVAADKQSGLGLVMMPHSYHPRGTRYAMPACGLGDSVGLRGALEAMSC